MDRMDACGCRCGVCVCVCVCASETRTGGKDKGQGGLGSEPRRWNWMGDDESFRMGHGDDRGSKEERCPDMAEHRIVPALPASTIRSLLSSLRLGCLVWWCLCFRRGGQWCLAGTLDDLATLGLVWSTVSGSSRSVLNIVTSTCMH